MRKNQKEIISKDEVVKRNAKVREGWLHMTSGQQFLLFVSTMVGLVDLLVSVFFSIRSYRKNPQRGERLRILISIITFLLVFAIIGILYLPGYIILGFMTYDMNGPYPNSTAMHIVSQINFYAERIMVYNK